MHSHPSAVSIKSTESVHDFELVFDWTYHVLLNLLLDGVLSGEESGQTFTNLDFAIQQIVGQAQLVT